MSLRPFIIGFVLLMLAVGQALYATETLLSFDKSETTKEGLPRNFRDLSVIGINAIASAQFSENELQEIRKKYSNKNIVIVDLRQETHGFINGKSVKWNSCFEKINQNKDISSILSSEKNHLARAKRDHEIVICSTSKRNRSTGWYNHITPKKITVNRVISEKNLAEEHGFEYQRFSVRDFDSPDEKEFSRMVKFIKTLPPNKTIYVHCAGGKGRTTLFLVTLDIIKNGKNIKLEDIFTRQSQLGGAKLDEMSDEEAWSIKIAEKRLNLLQDFYLSETTSPKNTPK